MSRAPRRTQRPADQPEPAPPPPPAGGRLVWVEEGRHKWTAQDRAHISRLTNGSAERYYVNRAGRYLGSEATLEAAKDRAQHSRRSPQYGDLPLEERRRLERDERENVASLTTKRGRAETEGEKAERRVIDTLHTEAKLAKISRRSEVKLDPVARIKILAKENWRKPGSGAHTRAAMLMQYDGRTVGDYVTAGGNPETLANAITAKRAELE